MKKGDMVSVLDETTTGKIITLEKNFALIEDAFGFEHKIELSKIVSREPEIYIKSDIIVKEESRKNVSKRKSQNDRILDLHFEKLTKNPGDYNSWERLQLQKETLLENLDYCRKNYIKRLNIIHGIGDGILQEMVYDTLSGYSRIEYEEGDFFFHSSGNVWVTFL